MQNQKNENLDKAKIYLNKEYFIADDSDNFDLTDDSQSNILCDECMPLGYCKNGTPGRITKEEAEENFINDILDPMDDDTEESEMVIVEPTENAEAPTQKEKSFA